MRIFVTGMTGFLGHELGQIFLSSGVKELFNYVGTEDLKLIGNLDYPMHTLYLGELGYGKWRYISKIELRNLFPK